MADQEIVTPVWLDKSFLSTVLRRKYGDDSILVTSFNVSVATKKGESFASEMFRISARTSTGMQHNLILKKPHTDKDRSDAVEEYQFFGKEMNFFNKFLPEVNEILRSVDEWEELCPQLIYCDQDMQVLVMEDLRDRGYASGERESRISREAAKILMRKLAKLHAALMTLNVQRNGELEREDTFGSYFQHGQFNAFFKQFPYALIEEVQTWGSEFAGVVPKLEKIADSFITLMHDSTISRRGWNVMAHNDLWYTNIMMKKEGREVVDVLMIDFQLNRWASIASDLLYICFRDLNVEDYADGVDYLIEVYHSHLQRVLQKLRLAKVPTFEDILAEVHDNFFHGGGGFHYLNVLRTYERSSVYFSGLFGSDV